MVAGRTQEWSGVVTRRQFTWEPFNASYGPWYRMRGIGKDGVSIALKHAGRGAEAIVQPDMDRGSWYWSVKFKAYRPRLNKEPEPGKPKPKPKTPLPERRIGGRAPTLEEAQKLAESTFLLGRSSVLKVVK